MSVDHGAQQRLLRDAAAALKNGNRVRSRDLALRAIQANRDVETAWWLLYQTLDDPLAQTRALENVLRLNPQQAEAQQALLRLRQQTLGAAQGTSFLTAAPQAADDGLDDQFQCPYCGEHTALEDRKCPHCGGGLFARVARSRGTPALRLVELLLGISLAAGIVEMIGPAMALGAAQAAANRSDFGELLGFAAVRLVLGNFLQIARPEALLLIELFAVRAGVLALAVLGLRAHWSAAFYGTLLATCADLLLSAYLLVGGGLGVVGALLNGALALAAGVLLFGLSDEFAVTPERLLVKPDTQARSALDFYRLGQRYRQRGMWALAVAQWRRAVGLAPQTAQYYKHLGIGYAQIQRYDLSLRTLAEGQRRAPNDREIAEIIALVKSRAETHALVHR